MLKWEHFGSAGECVLVEKKYYGCTVLYVVRGQIEYDIYRPVLDELIMLLHLGRCAADSKEVYHPSSPPTSTFCFWIGAATVCVQQQLIDLQSVFTILQLMLQEEISGCDTSRRLLVGNIPEVRKDARK